MNLQLYLVLALQLSISLMVLGFGLTASWGDATWLLRQPGLLLRSILSMSIIMPLVAIGLAKAFSFPAEVEAALVALALAPVPPLLHKKQLSAGGRPEYVIGLLVAMGLLSIILVPLSVSLLSKLFSISVIVPPLAIAKIVLTSVLAPLAVGLLIRQWFPAAEKASSYVIAAGGALLVIGAAVLLWGLWPVVRRYLGDGVALLLACFVAIGVLVGHLLGGPVESDRTTLAISTAQRHPAIALTIASAMTSAKKNELAVILLYLIIATIVLIPYHRWRARVAAAGVQGRGGSTPVG
jgi:bile acid:Na+ symporter, BASS family